LIDIRRKWSEVSTLNWGDISLYQWGKLVLVFIEVETEQLVQGVRIDQTSVILTATSELVVNIVVSERDYKRSMLDYLPWYEQKSIIFDEILNAYDRELRRLEQELDVVKRNMFLDTTVEFLPTHERDLGIKNVSVFGYDQRREQISSRYRAVYDQTTEDTIKAVALAYGNGEIEINTTDTAGLYEIKFIGKGIPNNLDGLTAAIDIIIPAHLGWEYTFNFNTWGIVSAIVWGDCVSQTWDELRVWEEVI